MQLYRSLSIVGGAFLGVLVCCVLVWPGLRAIILESPLFNGFIGLVFAFGLGYSVLQFFFLWQEKKWWDAFSQDPETIRSCEPRFYKGLKSLLHSQRFSTSALSTLSDAVTARFEAEREPLRYTTGLLIFLGLLGTFWGLAHTIQALSQVIADIPASGVDMEAFFGPLKRNLQKPLFGMGFAFSSSLVGLASSLFLGFFELQLSLSHQSFVREVEERLVEQLKPFFLSRSEGESPAFLSGFLAHLEEHLERLQKNLLEAEKTRRETENCVALLAGQIGRLTDQMRLEQNLMVKLAQGSIRTEGALREVFSSLVARLENDDEVAHERLRQISFFCEKIALTMESGQQEMVNNLCEEIRLLGRTLRVGAVVS